MELAARIRSEIEAPTTRHLAKQLAHRKSVQNVVEKKFKQKQTQESFVVKAREKFEGDCTRITSYSQQINTTQGKDLERLQAKLKRAQQTVAANEKDFATFSKTLAEMQPSWEAEWKDFCDTCQDLEEERVEFMKDILWFYANAISTLCVSDDEVIHRMLHFILSSAYLSVFSLAKRYDQFSIPWKPPEMWIYLSPITAQAISLSAHPCSPPSTAKRCQLPPHQHLALPNSCVFRVEYTRPATPLMSQRSRRVRV